MSIKKSATLTPLGVDYITCSVCKVRFDLNKVDYRAPRCPSCKGSK